MASSARPYVLGIARDPARAAARLGSLAPACRVQVIAPEDAREAATLWVIDRSVGDPGALAREAAERGVPCVVADGGALGRAVLAELASASAPVAIGGGGVGSIALATLVGRSRAEELGPLRRAIVRSPGGRRLLPAGSRRTAFDREGRVSFAVGRAPGDHASGDHAPGDHASGGALTSMLVPAMRAIDALVPGAAERLAITELVARTPGQERVTAHAMAGDVELALDLDRAMVGDEDWELEAEHAGGSLLARFRGDGEVVLVRAALKRPEVPLDRAPVEALLARHLLASARAGQAPTLGDARRALEIRDAAAAMLDGAEARRSARPLDVVLVHVPRFRNAFDELRLPSLAIARLAGYLRGFGFDVHIVDLEAAFATRPLPAFTDDARVARWLEGAADAAIDDATEAMWRALETALPPAGRAALVGFSIVDYFGHFQMNLASCLARLVRARTPHRIVLGGERDQVDGDRALDPGMAFDWVVDGDGEDALLGLASLVAYGDRRARSIPGVWSREEDGAIRRNALVRSHLSAMPRPDFDGFPLDAYRAAPSPALRERLREAGLFGEASAEPFLYLPYGFVKGCTAECTFCSAKEHLDIQPPEKCVDELLALRDRHGVRDFVFLNNLVNIAPRWLERFCRMLVDARADLQWTDSCRPTGISTELAALMRESGCLLLNFGAESGSDAVLARMKKGLTSSDIRATLRATHAAGIVNRVNLIAGYLHETEEDVDATIAMVEDLAAQIDVIGCFQGFYLFPGMGVDPEHERIAVRAELDRLVTGQLTMAYDEIGGRRWEEKRASIDASRNRILARIEALGIRTVDKIDEHDLFWLSRLTRDKRVVRAHVLADPPASGVRDLERAPANRAPLPPGGQRGRVSTAS